MKIAIVLLLLILIALILLVLTKIFKPKDYVTWYEIFEGRPYRIIDDNEKIFECQGKRFILSGGNLSEKKKLIESLRLFDLPPGLEVNLHYQNQIIVKGLKSDTSK